MFIQGVSILIAHQQDSVLEKQVILWLAWDLQAFVWLIFFKVPNSKSNFSDTFFMK